MLTAQPPSGKDHGLGRRFQVRYIPLERILDALAKSLLPAGLRSYRRLLVFPPYEWVRRRLATSISADIIHLHSYAVFRHYAGLLTTHPGWPIRPLLDWLCAFEEYGSRLLFTDHSLFAGPRDLFLAVGNDRLVEGLPNVVCVEKSGLENVRRCAADKGLVVRTWWIPNPVDMERFRAARLPSPGRIVVGYAGRYEKEGLRQVAELIESAPDWVDFRLALAGPEEVASASSFLGTRKGVRVDWNVPYSRMPTFYESIHVLLDPFVFGAPRTACESLASGRPVVRLRGDRLSRDFPASVSPVFDPEPASFFASLARLRDSGELGRMAGDARLYAEETYSAARVAQQYVRAYQEVASHRDSA